MKFTLSTILFLISASAFASCPKGISGSGRIWPSPIKKVELHGKGCRVVPSRGQTDADPFCPLDDSGIMTRGIEVGKVNGKCAYAVGSDFSGNVVNVDGEIWSESYWQKYLKGDVVGDETADAGISNSPDRLNTKKDIPTSKPSDKKSKGATAQ